MLLILPAALAILVAAGALAWRASQGQLASVFNSQTLGARKAAEMGISRLIADWNRPENRMLLASGSPAANWVDSAALRNPCTATTASPTGLSITGADLAAYRNGDWILVDATDPAINTRRYRLRRVTFRNWDRSSFSTRFTQTAFDTDTNTGNYPDMSANTSTSPVPRPFFLGNTTDPNPNTNPANPAQNTFGFVEVEIEGQVIRGTTVLASSRVVKEFQVVPKCCNRSFYRTQSVGIPASYETYGNDSRICDKLGTQDDKSPIPIPPRSTAVLIGLNLQTGAGLQKLSGSSWTLRVAGTGTDPNNPVQKPNIYCTSASQNCDGEDSDTLPDATPVTITGADDAIGVYPFNTFIPNPPTVPTGEFTTGPGGSQVNAGGQLVASPNSSDKKNYPFGSSITLPVVKSTGSYCGFKSGAFHCLISSIDKLSGNTTITVDSSKAPVYLYLQGSIESQGNTGFSHTGTVDRFRIYGLPRNSPTSQTIALGGNSGNTSVFIYAPIAFLDLGGSATYTAITWVDRIKFGSNVSVFVPKGKDDCPPNPSTSDPELVYCRILVGDPNTKLQPLAFDWVARSETSTRFYGNSN